MYEARFDTRQPLGLMRHTGSNRGLYYTNERTEVVTVTEEADSPDGSPSGTTSQHTEWIYDVYEIEDARSWPKAKNDIASDAHPFGDETKILRKTLAALLKAQGLYGSEDFQEFQDYNEFMEQVRQSS